MALVGGVVGLVAAVAAGIIYLVNKGKWDHAEASKKAADKMIEVLQKEWKDKIELAMLDLYDKEIVILDGILYQYLQIKLDNQAESS
jgi:hypothetical protein